MDATDVNMVDSPHVAIQIEDLKVETGSEDDVEDWESTEESSVDEDHHVPQGLPTRSLPSGLCYDERMRYHAEVSALSAEAVHPEDPRRIYYIFKELCEAGLVVAKGYTLMTDQPLVRIDAREATEEEITLVHTPEHYDFVRRTAGKPMKYVLIQTVLTGQTCLTRISSTYRNQLIWIPSTSTDCPITPESSQPAVQSKHVKLSWKEE